MQIRIVRENEPQPRFLSVHIDSLDDYVTFKEDLRVTLDLIVESAMRLNDNDLTDSERLAAVSYHNELAARHQATEDAMAQYVSSTTKRVLVISAVVVAGIAAGITYLVRR